MNRDRALIAQVIEREMKRHPEIRGRKSRLAHRADVTRTTLDSALDPAKWGSTSSGTYNSIEIGLDLPVDTLLAVGLHDWQSMQEEGVDPALIAWATRRAESDETSTNVAGAS